MGKRFGGAGAAVLRPFQVFSRGTPVLVWSLKARRERQGIGWGGMTDMMAPRELMTTKEVADYLRIKERKVYDLVRERRIPCIRVTGKWLFPKALIELWVIQNSE